MTEINLKLETSEHISMPTKAYELDACYDIKATEINFTDDYIEYNTGIYLELPDDIECIIRSRSSISKYDLILANGIGTVDPGYRGELKVRFKIAFGPGLLFKLLKGELKADNFLSGFNLKLYNVGDKIGQISFHKVLPTFLKQVDQTSKSERDEKGFGSSDVPEHGPDIVSPV